MSTQADFMLTPHWDWVAQGGGVSLCDPPHHPFPLLSQKLGLGHSIQADKSLPSVFGYLVTLSSCLAPLCPPGA